MLLREALRKALWMLVLLASHLAGAAQGGVVMPGPGAHDYPLGTALDVFEDSSGAMTIADVANADNAGRFVPAIEHGLNFGFRRSAMWFRIQVDFSGARDHEWVLVETHPLIDHIAFFLPDGNNGWQATAMGDTLPYAARIYDHREFIMPLPRQLVDAPQPVTLYVRQAGEGAINVDLRLSSPQALLERTNTRTWLYGLYYGALMLVLLYNLPLWFATRERAQLYYLVFLGAIALLFLNLNGFGLEFLWPNLPLLNGGFPILACLSAWGGMQFTRHFLDIYRTGGRLDTALRWMSHSLLAALVLVFFLSRQTGYILATALPAFFVFVMFAAGVLRLRQGFRPARLFVAGWACLLLGAILTALGNLGILQIGYLAAHFAQISVVFQVALLSLALGERVRFLKLENERIQRELAVSTTHDRLTGLPNREQLEQYLPRTLAETLRHELMLVVLYVDMNNFKSVNESSGHNAGDEILVEIARRLNRLASGTGQVFRISGDEFVVIMTNVENEDDAILMAHNTIAELAAPYATEGATVHLTCSIGIRIADGAVDNPMLLVQQADLATQKAKRGGHNNYEFFTEDLNSRVARHISLRNELQTALGDNSLSVLYQPNIDSRTGRSCGFEALVRWDHPVHGLMSAAEFIPMAEETGQIVQIGQWVLETACGDCARLLDKGLRDARVAVNISPIQFQRTDFVDSIQAVLVKTGLPGEHLELDVTETVLMASIDMARTNIESLKRLGVSVSIDDFGTGYSSLGNLRHLPVNRIKIDEKFVHNVISDVQDAAIIKAIISMAHHLDLIVLAEGVETESQFEFLRRCGCDQFQGHFFAQPMDILAIEQYLIGERTSEPRNTGAREPITDTVLLVDDEPNILRALARVLRKDGYRILTAESANEAFTLLALNDVQLIISDQRMPKMTGTEFLARVKELYPPTIRIVLSGYTDLKSVTDAVNQGSIYRFLTKPWDDDVLREEVRNALSKVRRGQQV